MENKSVLSLRQQWLVDAVLEYAYASNEEREYDAANHARRIATGMEDEELQQCELAAPEIDPLIRDNFLSNLRDLRDFMRKIDYLSPSEYLSRSGVEK